MGRHIPGGYRCGGTALSALCGRGGGADRPALRRIRVATLALALCASLTATATAAAAATGPAVSGTVVAPATAAGALAGAPDTVPESPDPMGVAAGLLRPADPPATAAEAAEQIVTLRAEDGTDVVERYEVADGASLRSVQSLLARSGIVAETNRMFEVPRPQEARLAGESRGADQWGPAMIGAEDAWPVSTGRTAVVAVVDTGADGTHPDLRHRLLPQVDIPRDGRTGDAFGHGTHVAGIIAAALDHAGTVGVAYGALVLPVRVFGRRMTADTGAVAQGILAAVSAGADVINMSLGITGRSQVIARAVENAARHDVVMVAAVGNHYQFGNAPSYPAAMAEVIAVGAVGRSGRRAPFSATGPHLALAAPGMGILSTVPGGYMAMSGTSMAAPHVAAAAALVRAANPTLDRLGVARVLQSTARKVRGGGARTSAYGFGIVQAGAAVAAAAAAGGGVRAGRITTSIRFVLRGDGRFVAVVTPRPTAMLARPLVLQRWRGDRWRAVATGQPPALTGRSTWDGGDGLWRVTTHQAGRCQRGVSAVIRVEDGEVVG